MTALHSTLGLRQCGPRFRWSSSGKCRQLCEINFTEGRDTMSGSQRGHLTIVVAGRRAMCLWGLAVAMSLLFSTVQAGSSESQDPSQSAYFVPEFSLSPQGSFQEDATEERLLTYRHDDQVTEHANIYSYPNMTRPTCSRGLAAARPSSLSVA
ncbi:ADAMTS-like protein 3 isoform X1 [Arapaima gigas]